MIDTPRETLDLMAYIDASPTSFHCCAESKRQLDEAGFLELDERESWDLDSGQGYYVTREGALVALRLGEVSPVEGGFRIVGAHTDSPDLRVKPNPEVQKVGYQQLGVEVYGGPLNYTWLDRDLGLAGRVIAENPKGALQEQLIYVRRPIIRLPSLAIHLNRKIGEEGLKLNPQNHLPPIFGLVPTDGPKSGVLKRLLAEELDIEPDTIRSWDLSAVDVTAPSVGGVEGEFMFAPRIDNQASCHAALTAIIRAADRGPSNGTQIICLYDHEEVGSTTTTGAAGAMVESILRRLIECVGTARPATDLARAVASSFHVSADGAHAVHPNYSERHDPKHLPLLNKGPVIKINARQRYATTARSAAKFEVLCRAANIPYQTFVNRTDLKCGSTIGPISSTRLGIETVDVGTALLAMHSIREHAGVLDPPYLTAVLTEFLSSQ